ncbi:MAG TPA: hypothetical protein VFM93_05515 [Candidatus Limnocylindria bacterium]|nr:hypothetical protein [Candidatus Limnocylindria bacterium]
MRRIVLAVTRENADALLSGERRVETRTRPPARLPARAYLAVPREGIVGEVVLGEVAGRDAAGARMPVSAVKRYARPRPVATYGLAKTPRSFRYVG